MHPFVIVKQKTLLTDIYFKKAAILATIHAQNLCLWNSLYQCQQATQHLTIFHFHIFFFFAHCFDVQFWFLILLSHFSITEKNVSNCGKSGSETKGTLMLVTTAILGAVRAWLGVPLADRSGTQLSPACT